MKSTKKTLEDSQDQFAREVIDAFKNDIGPMNERREDYTEAEWRVLQNSYRFEGIPETVENAGIAVDMLYDRWEDFVDLEHYLCTGDWQRDYEADERGEIRKDLPRGVLSQDELYNSLMELHAVLKDMRRLLRHYKSPHKEKADKA